MRAETADDLDFDIDSDIGDEADDHFFLFKAASKGPDALKIYLDGLPRHVRKKASAARNVTFDLQEPSSNLSPTELMLVEIATKRGWTEAEGDEFLAFLQHRDFNASDIASPSFRALFLRLKADSAAEPEFRVVNLWKEGDGEQKVELHYRDVKSVFLEIITNVDAGELDLFFHAVIDSDGHRWFTAHANSGTWWEKQQKKVGPDVAIGAALFYLDGVHIKQNIGLQAAYRKSMHLCFIPTC